VTIGSRSFERVRELGSGSFGVVWEVIEKGLESSKPALALKKTSPAKQEMLEACLLEAEVLQQLADMLPADLASARCVPRYEAHCTLATKPPQ
ncbi:unnamed protein product, partial [Polarella glacialis]